jgi:integrase
MRRTRTVPIPEGVFSVKGRKGQTYWYFQKGRGTASKGPLVRLPGGPDSPEFWTAYHAAQGPASMPGSIKSVIEEYKRSPRWARLREGSKNVYGIALNRISQAWGHLTPEQVSPAGVATMRDQFGDRPNTGNLTLSVVQEFFRFCAERGLCRSNPAREVRRLEVDLDAGAKPIPEPIYQHIIKHAPEPIARYFQLGRATGQRISDVLKMRPADRDGAGIKIEITKRRKDRQHWIPLTQAGMAEIDGWNVLTMVPYVTGRGGKRQNPKAFRMAFNAWKARPENALVGDVTPHDLRATAVCDDRIAGYSHQEISARRGMSMQMVMHYSRHVDERLIASRQNEKATQLKTARKAVAKRGPQATDK